MKQIILPCQKADTITLPALRESGDIHKVIAYATKDKVAVLVQESGKHESLRYGFRYLEQLFYNRDKLYFEADTGDGAIGNALKEANQTCFRREVFTFSSSLEFLTWAKQQLKK